MAACILGTLPHSAAAAFPLALETQVVQGGNIMSQVAENLRGFLARVESDFFCVLAGNKESRCGLSSG